MVDISASTNPIIVQTPDKSKCSFTDYLANERTFLAWSRTSLGIFAFGCAVAQFGGSKNTQTAPQNSFQEKKALICGLILISCGIISMLYSIYRFYRINRQITKRDLTDTSQIREPIIVAFVLLLAMIVLVIIFFIL